MIRQAQCPSCGAKVSFRASISLITVCEYCKSTLIRTDIAVESLGKMADLLEDSSLIQLRAHGRYKGGSFTVIGRVQYQYPEGLWNEWHILFNTGKTGWLSEASGNYVLTFIASQNAIEPTPFSDYLINHPVIIAGQQFRVTALETAKCIAGEGELPFNIAAGFETQVVDLSNDTAFASIDFSETPPLVFVGEQVELSQLGFTGLREPDSLSTTVKPRSFNCPSCAAPLTVNLASSKSIVCESCTAVVGIKDKNLNLIKQYQVAAHIKPLIELGSTGHFKDGDFTAIGYMIRNTNAGVFSQQWREYLLHNPTLGFRWLTEANGHWNYLQTTKRIPRISKSWFNDKTEASLTKKYKHFEHTKSKVVYVLGEFYWRVSFDDSAIINDYIAPPSILSEERTNKEVTWTEGDYIEAKEIEAAFQLSKPLPLARGVAPNQPSYYQTQSKPMFKAFMSFIALGLLLQIGFIAWASHSQTIQTSAEFSHEAGDKSFESASFDIKGHASNVVIEQTTSVNDDWIATEVTLIEKNTGASYHAIRDASFYSGYDQGEYWTEGSNHNEIVFSKIPTGQYYLHVEADTEINPSKSPIRDYITVTRNVPFWGNLLLLWLALSILPLILFALHWNFEIKRWANSDHPLTD